MDYQKYPALKRRINLRISKGRFIIKDLCNDECYLEAQKDAVILLSLCDGTQRVADIITTYKEATNSSEEEAKARVENVFDKYKAYIEYFDKEKYHIHVSSFKKILAYRSKRWEYSPLREESPFNIQVSLTEKCNHRCNYCYKSCEDKADNEIAFKYWEKTIEDAFEMGIQEIVFTGGEPTLYPGFIELVNYATQKGIYPKVVTNGTMMNEEFVQKLKEAGVEHIHLSLPAISEEIFNEITGAKGNLDKVKRGIDILHRHGFFIHIKVVIVPQNINDIENIIDYCAEHGVNIVELSPFILSGCSRGDFELIPQNKDLQEIQELAIRKQEIYKDKIEILEPSINDLQWKCSENMMKCGGIKDSLMILSNGDISFCEPLANECDEFVLGNIKETSLVDIWCSHKPDSLFEIPKDRLSEECKECEYIESCQTGCFMFSHMVDKNPWASDPRCWKNKSKENVFREVAKKMKKYPVLKNTARIKKLPDSCLLLEAEHDIEEFIAPIEAFIIAMCTGMWEVSHIKYIVENVFRSSKEAAEELVDKTLDKLKDCFEWETIPREAQTRYNPQDFIYTPNPGVLNKAERCDTPSEMTLSLTKACNFRCIYCFNAADKARKDELKESEWLDVIKQAAELGVIKCTVTGGEPTLHPSFYKILEELKKYDILTYVCTNGSLVTDEMINKFLGLGIEMIQISLDTCDNEVNEKLSGVKGMLSKVEESIRKLAKAKIKVCIKSVLTPLNLAQVPRLIDTCKELGVSKLIIDRFDISSCGRGDLDLIITEKDMQWVRDVVIEKLPSLEGKMQVKSAAHPTKWCSEKDIVPCGAFRKSFIVLPSGDISACEKLIDVPEMTAGNVRKKKILEIWQDNHTSQMINPAKEELDEVCRTCEQLDKCGTGCYAIKHYFKQRLHGVDPRCYKVKEDKFSQE